MMKKEPILSLPDATTAVVTGSTRGIGASIAKHLAISNANVVVSGRSKDRGNSVVNDIRDSGGSAIFVETDVRDLDNLKTLIETTVSEYGGVDVLVNNAAVETDTSPDEVEMEDWNKVVETDFRAYWLAAKYAYPYLRDSQNPSLINVSSNHAFATEPRKFPYNAVKAGINGMTRAMAVAWGKDGIRVNAINPGWTMVDRVSESLSDDDLEYLKSIHPLDRLGEPKDVARVALFLVSNLSGFVTGECILVDGGRTAVLQDDLYLKDVEERG